jgi:hypothetical protein
VSFADRVRAWFKGESKRSAPSPSTDSTSRAATRELAEFISSRHGVEAYLEPKTALYSTTLLLVADDGEYLRRPIGDAKQAASFCDKQEIPLYDARKVGYPRRMRDYERGQPPRRVSLDELPPWPGGEEPGAASHPPDEDPAGPPDDGGEEPPPPPPTR